MEVKLGTTQRNEGKAHLLKSNDGEVSYPKKKGEAPSVEGDKEG